MTPAEAKRTICPVRSNKLISQYGPAGRCYEVQPARCVAEGCGWWERFGRDEGSDGQCSILNLGIIANWIREGSR
jgi:hypothetical protein